LSVSLVVRFVYCFGDFKALEAAKNKDSIFNSRQNSTKCPITESQEGVTLCHMLLFRLTCPFQSPTKDRF
jgi:hypothetical protein